MMKPDNSLLPWVVPLTFLAAPIYAANYLTIAEAQTSLFPTADTFIDHRLLLSDKQRAEIKKRSKVRQRNSSQAIWRAEKEGRLLGWFIVDDVIGKHEFITYATAISPAGEVLGIEIMTYRESHGDQVREAEWRAQFNGKTLEDPLKLGEDISNISGATLSCRNVLDGVRRLLVLHELMLSNA